MAQAKQRPTVQSPEDDGPGPKPTPELVWLPDRRIERRISARYFGGTAITVLSWGDGHKTDLGINASQGHVYEKPGIYMLILTTIGIDAPILATAQVHIKDGLEPDVTWRETDPNWLECVFPAEGDAVSKYMIDWHDGKPDAIQEVWGVPGTSAKRALPTGEHKVYVKDLHSGRAITQTHTVVGRVYDPDMSLAEDTTDTTRMTAELTISKVTAGKPVEIDFGEGEIVAVADPKVGTKYTHQYSRAGEYLVQLGYADQSTEGKAAIIPLPFADNKNSGRP